MIVLTFALTKIHVLKIRTRNSLICFHWQNTVQEKLPSVWCFMNTARVVNRF